MPLIVGYNPPGNLGNMINSIKKNRFFLVDNGKAKKSMVLANDVAKLIINIKGQSGIYNLTDGHHPSFNEITNIITDKFKKRNSISLPYFIVKFASIIGTVLFGRKFPLTSDVLAKMTNDLTFDDSRARKYINWKSKKLLKIYTIIYEKNHYFFKNHILRRDSFENDIKKNENFLFEKINNSSLLVIGGAGTIGSNYIKQILNYKPKRIVVVDSNENGLTELTRDLRSGFLLNYKVDFRTYPMNLNETVFNKLFLSEDKFDVVANFAAHKHVRSEKDIFSIEALIRNNVYGAIKLIKLLESKPPEIFLAFQLIKQQTL